MHRSLLRFAVALVAAMVAPVFGQSIVAPNGSATVKGNDTSGPVDGLGALRFQTVIDPDQFPSGPINITGFTWRAAPGTGALSVSFSGSIYLSTSPNWANSTGHTLMSTTFANNVGADNMLVMSPGNFVLTLAACAGAGPCPFGNNITFTTPFPYDPANGPLLIDAQLTAASASGTGQFDVITCLNTSCAINGVSGAFGAATGTMNDDPRFGGSNIAQITYTPATINLNQHGLTGSWYEKATDGQGVEVEVFPDHVAPGTGDVFVSWFTYDTAVGGADHQRWYTAQGHVVTGQPSASLTIHQNIGGNFNAPPVTTAQSVGTATLSFDTCSSGQLTYSFSDGTNRTGTIALTRLTQNVTCAATSPYATNPDFALSGNWFALATSGQGFTAEVNPLNHALFAAWYTYAPNGTTLGAAGQRWYTALGNFTPGMRSIPVTIYEDTGGLFDAPTVPPPHAVPVGTGTMAFQSCSAATFTYNFTGGTSVGLSGSISLIRVGPAPPGCTS